MTSCDKRIVECLENLQCVTNTTVAILYARGYIPQCEIEKYVEANSEFSDTLDSLKAELEGGSDD